MEKIHGGDGMQGDPYDSDNLHGPERITHERRKMDEELITKLLEVTHGQWLYQNIQVHDKVAGTLATLRKEEIQMEIEEQQALGTDGLLDEDCHLGECNLGDLEDTSGIKETYWLLAIKAAREAGRLEALRTQTNSVGTTT